MQCSADNVATNGVGWAGCGNFGWWGSPSPSASSMLEPQLWPFFDRNAARTARTFAMFLWSHSQRLGCEATCKIGRKEGDHRRPLSSSRSWPAVMPWALVEIRHNLQPTESRLLGLNGHCCKADDYGYSRFRGARHAAGGGADAAPVDFTSGRPLQLVLL